MLSIISSLFNIAMLSYLEVFIFMHCHLNKQHRAIPSFPIEKFVLFASRQEK